MITFSCNVPQIALTFGKYLTSGPIQLQTSFLEEERNDRGGQCGVCRILEASCFPAQSPFAEITSPSPQRPRDTCPHSASTWGQGPGEQEWRSPRQRQSSRLYSKSSQKTCWEPLHQVWAWQEHPAISRAPSEHQVLF